MDTFDVDELERIFEIKNEGDFEKQVWTADIYNDKYILITIPFSFDTEFKNYLKSIGGNWSDDENGCFFLRTLGNYIVRKIQLQFPYWLCMNNLIIE